MKNMLHQFFSPIKKSRLKKSDYACTKMLINSCNISSRVSNQSIYIIDYQKQNFLYVSPHPLFLCGYSPEEVLEMGYSFYEKVVSPDELEMLLELNKTGWKLFYENKPEDRNNFCVSYDFHLQHRNGNRVLINHKILPVCLTEDQNIWLAMCIVKYSPHKTRGNVVFSQTKKPLYYTYNFDTKQVVSYTPETLSKREENVLRLILQGHNEATIAQEMHISTHTVKSHRRNIEKKLGVNSISNAIAKFYSSF